MVDLPSRGVGQLGEGRQVYVRPGAHVQVDAHLLLCGADGQRLVRGALGVVGWVAGGGWGGVSEMVGGGAVVW